MQRGGGEWDAGPRATSASRFRRQPRLGNRSNCCQSSTTTGGWGEKRFARGGGVGGPLPDPPPPHTHTLGMGPLLIC